jgi:8-oxo-dGTP diphosphatase
LIGRDSESKQDAAFREGCNFAYFDVLDIIASQIEAIGFCDKDLFNKDLLEMEMKYENLDKQCYSIGIDGCKGGWICAAIVGTKLAINRFPSITNIIDAHLEADSILIDMPVGLQSNTDHIRPDTYARQIIRERASTIFPAPCRQAIYAETVSQKYEENERVLGKKFTPLTVGIIPKIKEVDLFLQNNPHFKNRLLESHPEVCFAILKGRTLLSKKNELDGINERISVLKKYLPMLNVRYISDASKQFKCMMDDVVDAICLAVVGTFAADNKCYTIPPKPMSDDTGLLMQMILPKLG